MASVRQNVKLEHLTMPPSRVAYSPPPAGLRVANFRRAAKYAPCLQCGQPTKARLLFVAMGEVPTHMACSRMEASSPTLDNIPWLRANAKAHNAAEVERFTRLVAESTDEGTKDHLRRVLQGLIETQLRTEQNHKTEEQS